MLIVTERPTGLIMHPAMDEKCPKYLSIHLAFGCRPIFIFQEESCFYKSGTHTHTHNELSMGQTQIRDFGQAVTEYPVTWSRSTCAPSLV